MDQVIKIESGYISGTILGEPGKEVYVFRGIPYAAPPVRDLRWKPPHPAVPWSGIRECTVFSQAAPQLTAAGQGPIPQIPQSEDCLYLNVLTPAKKASDSLPVMVWMHGGGFSAGNANDTLVNGLRLPLKGIVLVNVNMRLGPLGCLAHPLLTQESPDNSSGNYQFLDMIASLKWVKKNIAAFGGDPGNVTIFGQSGGGAKVVNLMASPLAKGLFQRAIGQSGGGQSATLKFMEDVGERLFAKVGANREPDQLKAARAVSWQKIIEAGKAVNDDLNMPMGPWDSVVDGWFLPDAPAGIFKAGKQNVMTFIMGANLGELTGPGNIYMPQVIQKYTNLFSGANLAGSQAYGYIFDQVPQKWRQEGCVCPHAMELCYVFGDWDNSSGFWTNLYRMAASSGAKQSDPGLTEIDRKVSESVMTIWANFAKTGKPVVSGLVDWPAWEKNSDLYLYITDPLQVKSGYSRVVANKL